MTQPASRIAPSIFSHAYENFATPRTAAICFLAFSALAALVAFKVPQRIWSAVATQPPVPVTILCLNDKQWCAYSFNTYGGPVEEEIDFTRVIHQVGIGYVADVEGHGNTEMQTKIARILDSFSNNLGNELLDQKKPWIVFSPEALSSCLTKNVIWLQNALISAGITSTFSLAALTEAKDKKCATIVHTGNSSLFHLKPTGEMCLLTPHVSFNSFQLGEKKGFQYETLEVESGDRIIGMTDGITKVLSMDQIRAYLLAKGPPEGLGKLVASEITDAKLRDDCCWFELTVP